MFHRLVPLLAISAVALLSGCASFDRIAPYPTPSKAETVAIVATPMSKMSELPMGVFYDEPRHIIITGHQKGAGVGMMFGLVGVLVADQVNKSGAETRFGTTAQASKVDVGTILADVVKQELDAGIAPGWSLQNAPAHVQLTPYALFTVLKSGQARLYAVLRAEVPGSDGKPKWSGRYFVRADGERPVETADGWMSGTYFADGMHAALQQAVRTCAEDLQGKLTGTRTVKARGIFPYLNTDTFELPFIVVKEDDQHLIAKLAAGDAMVMAGTHVLNRADYKITDAKFKDPRTSGN
ncbi:MAG TPA: hypothetical protein VFJ90_05490 [Candidatus Didemnitutus sp.]|nr:hypothetical protein [Candidatus Didemnitutus sp.]